MRVYQNFDYKGKQKPKVSGHKKGWIYSPVYLDKEGRRYQNVRPMPSHYNDAETGEQLTERNDMKRVMRLHSILKDVYQDCFEGKGRSYTRFISANRKAEAGKIIISSGSLPSLEYSLENNKIELFIEEKDWDVGDELRQVRATIDGKEYFALIHMRQTADGWLCSSQELMEIRISESQEFGISDCLRCESEGEQSKKPLETCNLEPQELLYILWMMGIRMPGCHAYNKHPVNRFQVSKSPT